MFRICLGNVLGMFRACLGHVFGVVFGHVLDMFWDCFGHVLGMIRARFGHALGIFWGGVEGHVREFFYLEISLDSHREGFQRLTNLSEAYRQVTET